ncbi:MAG: hypothetical protein WBN88_17205 [Anderseniella sp.]
MKNLLLISAILFGCVYSLATVAVSNSIDDQCFVSYSQAAGRCNSTFPNDHAAFQSCLAGPKTNLSNCCRQDGASADCDADAQPVNAAGEEHKCARHALKQAKKLLEFHFGGPDDRMEIEQVAKPVLPIKNPVGKDNYDVLQVWAWIYKGRYRMQFIYGYAGEECVLMGQEILEYANL